MTNKLTKAGSSPSTHDDGVADASIASPKQADALPGWTRRLFLAACAALGTGPAWAAPRRPPPETPRSGNVDVIIIGAGAAGIAAGRRLAASGRRFVLLEAANEIGGRCITDT